MPVAQDLEWSMADLELKLRIEAVLANMSIPHRTMLKDSKVYATMERWAKASPWDSGRSSGTSSPGPSSRYRYPVSHPTTPFYSTGGCRR